MPQAAFATTTAGGAIRKGCNASTTSCAAGRNRYSQRNSVAGRCLTERAKSSYWASRTLISAGERSNGVPVDRLRPADQLAGGIDLAPDVPEQESARPSVSVHVGDNAFAARLLPLLDGREARIDLSDGLVA